MSYHPRRVSGTASATFTNPQPTGGAIATTGVGTASFTWGARFIPVNQMHFTGSAFASNFESPFKLGTLAYFNGLSATGTARSGDVATPAISVA